MRRATGFVIGVLAICLSCGSAWAAPVGLPLEQSLEGIDTVTVRLDGAEIEVEISATESPAVQVVSLARDRASTAAPADEDASRLVSWQRLAVGVTLSRAPAPSEAAPPRLGVTLRLRPGQALEVVGSELSVTVAETVLPGASEAQPATPRRRTRQVESTDGSERVTDGDRETERGAVSIQVAGGQVDLLGVRSPQITADDAWVRFDRTAGSVEATLNRSTFEAQGHDGRLDLLSTDSDVRLAGLTGGLRYDGLGGALSLLGGRGPLEVTSEDTTTRLAEWRGAVTVTARGASTELLSMRGSGAAMRLALYDVQALLDDVSGAGQLVVEGGRFDARNCSLQAALTAESGAAVEWVDGRRDLELTVADGDLSLRRHAGDADVRLLRSTLALDQVDRLSLRAEESSVEGGGVASIGSFQVRGGSIDLRLSTLEAKPVGLGFDGEVDASLDLPSPCVVQLRSAQQGDGESVTVSGCDLRAPGQPMRSARQRAQYGRRPLQVTLTVGPEVSLDVQGGS